MWPVVILTVALLALVVGRQCVLWWQTAEDGLSEADNKKIEAHRPDDECAPLTISVADSDDDADWTRV